MTLILLKDRAQGAKTKGFATAEKEQRPERKTVTQNTRSASPASPSPRAEPRLTPTEAAWKAEPRTVMETLKRIVFLIFVKVSLPFGPYLGTDPSNFEILRARWVYYIKFVRYYNNGIRRLRGGS